MTSRDIASALKGISGVHVTPYGADGAIDAKLLASIVGRIAAAGVHAVVSAGNTGEFYALDADEIRAVHRAAIAGNEGRAVLIAGVGRSLGEAIALGRDAARAGADAVMVHQPPDPFAAPAAQADYVLAIADAVAVPAIAYVRSEALGVNELMRIADHPNVVGVKFATTNLLRLSECVRASGPQTAQWVCGLAEAWAAPFHALGARGFTSGLVNVLPERSLAILAALVEGDAGTARELVDTIAPFEAMRSRHGNGANVTVVKAALEMIGLPVGAVRLPGLPRLSPSERAELATILGGWGLAPGATESTRHQLGERHG
jgi:4-hydroxy-tetrahydrodipicolinate synthase